MRPRGGSLGVYKGRRGWSQGVCAASLPLVMAFSSFSLSAQGPRRYAQSVQQLSSRSPSGRSSTTYSVRSSSRGFGGSGFSGAGLGASRSFGLGSASFSLGGGGGGSGSSFAMGAGGIVGDEKNALQNLNERLANYLGRVQQLEQFNKDLERQIREFGGSNVTEGFDWSLYEQTVKPLQKEILDAMMMNSQIALEIDNAKLAAEDFQNKWQTELMLRQSVEADIDGLHQLKDTYLQLQGNVTSDIAGLEDEIAYLKKNHEEELKMLRQQKTQEMNVEVDSGPSIDLGAVLKELRDKYSSMAEKNQADLNDWYKEQLAVRETEITQNDQVVAGAKNELIDLRHQLQALDAEYNGLIGNLNALESTLCNTEASCAAELQSLQTRIAQLEGELGNIRNEVMRQIKEYENLLNVKMKLETEISQYRSLLDGSKQSLVIGGLSSGLSSGGSGTGSSRTTITSTTETKVF
ncbi:keratin, type I cytoskeletal 19-like [Narcine bancroftii]|uniref:keratin, type I cytoskeletal 19-like n=1 Tax=Narcine bancroftii TaxID=1343680 RepID=UPI003831B109